MAMEYETLRNYSTRTNNYQDDNSGSITNNTVYKQRDCWGWEQKQGTNTNTMTQTVTYPITYDAVPLCFATYPGYKDNSFAANLSELNQAGGDEFVSCGVLATNGMTLKWANKDGTGTLNSAGRFAAAWLARGTYASI